MYQCNVTDIIKVKVLQRLLKFSVTEEIRTNTESPQHPVSTVDKEESHDKLPLEWKSNLMQQDILIVNAKREDERNERC